MDPWAASLALSVVYDASKYVFSRGIKLVNGTPEAKAMGRILEHGFEHVHDRLAKEADPEVSQHVRDLLEGFVRSSGVAADLVRCVATDDVVPYETLRTAFEQVGLDRHSLPITFEQLIEALFTGLCEAVESELESGNSPLELFISGSRISKILKGIPILHASSERIERGIGGIQSDVSDLKQMMLQISEHALAAPESQSAISAQIASGKRFLVESKLLEAKAVFENIRTNEWSTCRDEQRYDVLATLAHVSQLRGDSKQASEYHVEAAYYAPSTVKRQLQYAYSYALLGENSKAHELAQQILDEEKDSSEGWNVWIQTAPESTMLEDVISILPATVEGDADVLYGLGKIARRNGNQVRAREFAGKSMEAAPNSAIAKYYYGLSILQMYEGQLPSGELGERAQRDLQESVSVLRESIEMFGEQLPPRLESEIRPNLAYALRMLGMNGEAREELGTLQRMRPDDPEIAFSYACILATDGLRSDAKRVLVKFLEKHSSDLVSSMAMELCVHDEPPNHAEAMRIVEKALESPETETRFRMLMLAVALDVIEVSVIGEKFPTLLLHAQELGEFEGKTVHAHILLKRGDLDSAKILLTQAYKSMPDQLPLEVRRYLADLSQSIGMTSEVLELRRKLLPSDRCTQDTIAFLRVAAACGRDLDILDECERLRKCGVTDTRLFEIEVTTLVANNCYKKAMEVVSTYENSTRQVACREHVVYRKLSLEAILGNRLQNEEDIKCLPRPSIVSLPVGENVVHLLYELGYAREALDYAYEFLSHNPDSVEAQRALVLGLNYDAPFDHEDNNVATSGTAIEYRIIDGEEDWIVLEEREAKSSVKEFGPGSPQWIEFLGKRIGDEVILRKGSIQDVRAKIENISSKYNFQVKRCIASLSQRSGPESNIELVRLKHDAKGQVGLEPILESLDRHEKSLSELSQLYASKSIPIACLSRIMDINVIKLMAVLKSELHSKVFCSSGSQREYSIHLSHFSKGGALVLDETVLATLFLSESCEFLRMIEKDIYVTEGVLQSLRQFLAESRARRRIEGTLGKNARGYTMVRVDKEGLEQWCKRLEIFIGQVESICIVVPGTCVYELPANSLVRVSEVLPRATLETLALASRNGNVLWTEDSRLYSLAKSEFKLKYRVWTQLIAFEQFSKGLLNPSEEARLTKTMLQLGFVNMTLTDKTVSALMAEASYSPTHGSAQLLFEFIEAGDSDPIFVFALSSRLLRETWQKATVDFQCIEFTNSLLGRVAKTRNGSLCVKALWAYSEDIFGLDMPNAERCRSVIDAWIRSTFI